MIRERESPIGYDVPGEILMVGKLRPVSLKDLAKALDYSKALQDV
jgi:hypothetical protein